jgi:hypothetical protein
MFAVLVSRAPDAILQAKVMISRLVVVIGPRCQSPSWDSIWKPASPAK